MQRIVLGFIAFCATLGAALGAFLFISLIPHFTVIGWAMTGLLILVIGCGALMMVSFTFNKIGSWTADRQHKQLQSRVIGVGDVVGYQQIDGTLIHLSAMHEAAKIPPLITAGKPREEEEEMAETSDETIIELWEKGLSLRTIEKALNIPYNRVQKVTSDEKKRRARLSADYGDQG